VDTAPPAPEETIIERELPVNAWAYEPEETVTEKTEMDVPADEIAAASTETVTETAPPVYEWANEPVATTLTGETSGEIDNEMVENTIPAEPEPEITAAASEPVMEEVAPDAGRIATADEEEPIKIFPLEIPEEETTLTFQPLYTDDYFAYKRLKEPERAEDLNEKGMAEMKSFTEWLREMKDDFAQKASKDWYHQQLHRIYEDEDPEVSETVEKMAMESITLNDDIVSETLAEIWARQHQYQTAIQIYQKLSLLNPNKSTYFAQKIQELRVQSQTDKN
jgi:tetratricopeptide (TPR) repeat protein